MTATYADLIVPESQADIKQRTLDLAAVAELPVTSWEAFSFAPVIVEVFSEIAADIWLSVARLARGLVLEFAEEAWLTLLMRSQFDDDRLAPVATEGVVTLTDAGGGPHVITAGTVRVSDGTRTFRNTTGGTIPLNGSLDVAFKAEAVGAAYNLPNGTITTMVTTLPTVTCSNPAIGSTGTWITTLGADVESDVNARRRMRAKWGTLSTGSPASAYLYWALSTVGVTRARVDDANPDGPGSLRVYIDNAGVVSTLQSYLNGKIPSGTRATAVAATSQTVDIPGVVTVSSSSTVAAAQAAVIASLTALANEIDIGGVVREAEVIERIMASSGVLDFVMGSSWAGTPNIQLTSSAIVQFALSLTYVQG